MEPNHFQIDLNWLADAIHSKMRLTHVDQLRTTEKSPFGSISKLKNRMIASRKIKDKGFEHSGYQMRFFSDFTEISVMFRDNIVDIIKVYNDKGESISIASNIYRQTVNNFVIESQNDIKMFAKLLYYEYEIRQYKYLIKSYQKQIKLLKNNQELKQIKSKRKLKCFLFPDNMILGYNQYSTTFNNKPNAKSIFVMRTIWYHQNGDPEIITAKKNTMKLIWNDVNSIDQIIANEKKKHHIHDELQNEREQEDEEQRNKYLKIYVQMKKKKQSEYEKIYNKFCELK
eukprot:339028_1